MIDPAPEEDFRPAARFDVKTLVIVAALIAALYYGREIFVPMALAGLLSLALEPLVTRLRRMGLGRVGSVLLVVLLALSLIAGIGLLLGKQAYQLADNLPKYTDNIRQKMRLLHSDDPSGGTVTRATHAIEELKAQVDSDGGAPGGRPAQPAAVKPIQVEQTESSFAMAKHLVHALLAPVGMAGLVFVFLVFMLLESESMRDRLIRLLGQNDLIVTTRGLGEAARRVSLYLRMQLIVNTAYGVPIGVGLYLIGVPNALLWGLLAGVLRFVPYLGPIIAAIFPIAMAIAVDPGWSMVLWTLAVLLVVELACNNVVEPLVYGRSTGLSAVAIVVGAVFWTTLWGPVGLLLATPLTVCLLVAARHVPQMHFLVVLLGNAPALSTAQRFYQRMLAGDVEEGVEMSEEQARSGERAAFVEEVVLPALRLAERDRAQRSLAADRANAVTRNVRSVLEEVMQLRETEADSANAALPHAVRTEGAGMPVVACVGGRTPLDTAAADALALRLRAAGIEVRVIDALNLSDAVVKELASPAFAVIVLVHLGESALAHVRKVGPRLRQHTSAKILLGMLNGQLPPDAPAGDLERFGADFMAREAGEACSGSSPPCMGLRPCRCCRHPCPATRPSASRSWSRSISSIPHPSRVSTGSRRP